MVKKDLQLNKDLRELQIEYQDQIVIIINIISVIYHHSL